MVTTTPPAPLRVVFFGTPGFAGPTLEALLRSRHVVAGVVTQPDRPRGRGHRMLDAPAKAMAIAAGVPVLQPQRLKDPAFIEKLMALGSDLGVVAAYGKILTDQVLAIPTHGFVNVHASLLPRYRGAAPVHRAVIAGERGTGVTIMRVVQALDAGPMLADARRPIAPDETSDEVERDLARLGAALLIATLDDLAAGQVPEMPQDDSQATYAPKLQKEEGLIDWRWTAERLHNLIRGLHPWPHAFTFLGTRRFIVRRSRWSAEPSPEAVGTVVEAAGDRLAVATGSGILEVAEIQAEGKRPMSARDFLAGHPLSRGERFGSS
ncbi:MAG: methionyl-tRNA formyltransferase [Acidobacteria bacterium]|nr:methionyl-tRNA formyltransferase [Acidobacteriota bacterium]